MGKHLMNIAGTICPAKWDKEFNKWYDEKHIPINMKFKGLMEITRYQLVRFTDTALVKKYPRYITPYRFKDLETFRVWNTSSELAGASEGIVGLFTKWGVELVWRVQYEATQTWGKTSPMSVITLVGTECSPASEVEFNIWYSEKHIPDLLKFKGLEGVTRYRLASSTSVGIKVTGGVPTGQTKQYPKYLTFYYFKDTTTADAYDESPERTATLGEFQEMIKEIGLSVVWRAQYASMRTWHK
jgi:antibiotic biosynthesis monooxygenase (ABM) superfamily enzyme